MSFINAIMALGAAAFVVPLAIHLLFRSRYKTLEWGAMFLLQDVVNANRRRMQWHQWILLALRCAIPILLALAMARPLLSSIGGQTIVGEAPVSLILLVDDSRSMSAGARSTRTIESLVDLLDSMSRRDEVMLIRSSESSSPPSTGSPRDARESLREIRFDGAPMDISATLQAGINACRDAAHPYRRIVLVSDFQESAFHNSDAANATSFLDAIDALSERLAGLKPRVELDFLSAAEPDHSPSTLANVVVESVSTDAPAILVGQPVPLSATVRDDSELPVTNLRAGWMIDGRVVETQTVSIEAGGTARLNWEHIFERPGGVSVGLSVEHADAIAADNRREWALDVLRPIRVWLVDGEPSREPLRSETDFLKVALSPFAFQSAGRDRAAKNSAGRSNVVALKDLVSTQVMGEQTLVRQLLAGRAQEQDPAEKVTVKPPDLIVLANVERPPKSPDDQDPLADYLAAGGRVLFFDGDQINASAWADCAWLPTTVQDTVDAKEKPFRIDPPGGRLAVWRSLGGSEDSLFDSVEVSRLRMIIPRDNSASIWLRTDSGAPLVVTRTISSLTESEVDNAGVSGRVVQFAIPCDTAWSNLPLRPVFLPMMQQLVLELVGSDCPGSVLPGAAMTLAPVSGLADDDGVVWQVMMPDGRAQTRTDSARLPLVFRDTNDVGTYRFRGVEVGSSGGEGESVDVTGGKSIPRVRVVEVPASESNLRGVAPELLAETAERLGADRYSDVETLVAASQRARFGMEIWRPLLWLLLVVMVGEILWQQLGVTRSASRLKRVRREAAS